MPELPDILAYIDALEPRVINQPIESIRLSSPFLVRSVSPPLTDAVGRHVRELRRVGKRIVFGLEGELFLVVHLMIAGRFHWKDRAPKPNRQTLATFLFPTGALLLTEAGSKRRASLYVVQGESGVETHDPHGIEILDSNLNTFRDA